MDQQSCRLVARFNIDLNQGIIINRTKYTKCNDIFKKNKEKTLLLGSDLKHSINYSSSSVCILYAYYGLKKKRKQYSKRKVYNQHNSGDCMHVISKRMKQYFNKFLLHDACHDSTSSGSSNLKI